ARMADEAMTKAAPADRTPEEETPATGAVSPTGDAAVAIAGSDDDDDDDDEDEETLDEVMVMDDDAEEAVAVSDDASTVTLRLSTDLRRRLRRRADREGVTAEELAEELLGAAIRRPAAESLTEVLARVDKLERLVAELGTARPRPETPAPPRRPEERPRGDFGSRGPSGGFGDRNNDRPPSDRPSYGDRGGYAGPRRPDDRPRFSERPPAGGFGRPEGRFGDRPRNDTPDRGPARPFDRRNEREDSRDRPSRRWESPRRGE
ncbi:MAG: hypothetical protein ACR2JY_20760, partial [Chloroflexota bacterium]